MKGAMQQISSFQEAKFFLGAPSSNNYINSGLNRSYQVKRQKQMINMISDETGSKSITSTNFTPEVEVLSTR